MTDRNPFNKAGQRIMEGELESKEKSGGDLLGGYKKRGVKTFVQVPGKVPGREKIRFVP